jgi:hypothetical protein
MVHRARGLVTPAVLAAGTVAVVLVLALPRTTHAEPIEDGERRGEWEEEGMKFGDIVVKGQLVATSTGGWTLVRTLENRSDEPAKCVLEERIMRTETMIGARVGPPARAVLLRNQPIALGPNEKRTIGVRLPEALSAEIAAAHKKRVAIERAYERGITTGKVDSSARQTFHTFEVEYYKPLPPGATAAPPEDNGVTRPGSMIDVLPPPSPAETMRQ